MSFLNIELSTRADFGAHILSKGAFLTLLSLLVLGGLALATLTANISYNLQLPLKTGWVVMYFAIFVGGMYLAMFAEKWPLRCLGHLVALVAIGLLLGPALYFIDESATKLVWGVGILLTAFIIYDIARAMKFDRTPANVVDGATALYLDIYEVTGGVLVSLLVYLMDQAARLLLRWQNKSV